MFKSQRRELRKVMRYIQGLNYFAYICEFILKQ